MDDPYNATMKLRNLVLFLTLMVVAFTCVTGCTSTGGGYGSTPNPATPVITPGEFLTTGAAVPVSAPPVGAQQTVTIELTAKNMAFNQSVITVPAGATVIVNFHNREDAGSSQVTGISHNFAVYDSPAAGTTIFSGEIITGGEDASYRFTAPATPGTYFFRCDVHPALMTGKFIVR